MLTLPNGCLLTNKVSELPNLIGASNVFLDYETTSGNPKEMSVNPWRFCDIAGFAVTVDDWPSAAYFDWMHAAAEEKEAATRWLNDLLKYAARWINHHVKYDAHVGTNYGKLEIPYYVKLVCTIVAAKLVDSDMATRGGYALDKLCKTWLNHDISGYEQRLQPYLGSNNKDYGRIPSDILGEYACVDVLENRLLYNFELANIPDRCKDVWNTEIDVTRELFDCEQFGMRFDPTALRIEQFKAMNRICELDDQLTALCGRAINVKSNDDCMELLCGQYGLPIVKFTKDSEGDETDNASFDKHALKAYKAMPYAPQDLIDNIIEQRKLLQRNSLYYVPWLDYAPDGIIHSTYNQVVRTGRMSGSEPNPQQLDSHIKQQVIPRPGNSIFSTDASQIEFRMIVHYIQDQTAIDRFNENPDEDFHQIVADICGTKRKPAKTINFGTAFGEGKKKLISQIAADSDIIAEVKAEVEALGLLDDKAKVVEFERRVIVRGEAIYDRYHAMLPTLKATAKHAESICKSLDRRRLTTDGKHAYGYITNLFGRDRHLPYCLYRTDYKTRDPLDKAWLAFPSLNQSSAADLMKERLVALMQALYGTAVKLLAVVHDEIVLEGPSDIVEDLRFKRDCVGITEHPRIKISVPIRWSCGVSNENWGKASNPVREGGCSDIVKYERNECENFGWIGS